MDAFASESNWRAELYWIRFAEPGSEAVDVLSVEDWGKSRCHRCGSWHQEVIYAFPPSGFIRHVVLKAAADSALCVLVVPVATTAAHGSKLVLCSLLSCRHAPDGYLRIRALGSQLHNSNTFDPKELAVFVCDFALAGGGGCSDPRLAPASAGAYERRARPQYGSLEDAMDRSRLREQLLAARSSALTGAGWRS